MVDHLSLLNANFVSLHNNKMDWALNKTNNEQEKVEWFSRAIKDKQDIEEMRDKPVKGKYCTFSKQLSFSVIEG